MPIKSRMRKAVASQQLPSNHETATLNRAGGVAFDIKDPAVKLITMTAGAFFMEPRYYEGTLAASRVAAARGAELTDKFSKLEQRIQINEDAYAKVDVDEVTKEILLTAGSIAKSDAPEDLLIIARWLRNEMNIRATPQALLVVASRFSETQPFVRRYASVIAVRPDEIKTCMLMHRFFFGMKTMKNCLARGLSDALANFGERALLKYDSPGWPTWKDVLQVLPRGKDRPLSQPLANYFLKGEVTHPEETPILAARKALSKLDKFGSKARELATKSVVNWEVLLSQFGNEKAKVWEFLINENLVGYMALLRNLRNMLKADVDIKIVNKVVAKLSDPEEVARSKQLPFRFFMAHLMLEEHFQYQSGGNALKLQSMLEAIENAATLAADNVPLLPGVTAIFADNSGSMGKPVSEKSKMSCANAANILCGIAARRCEKAIVAAFASAVAPVPVTRNSTVIDTAYKVQHANTNGMSTNAYLIPQFLEENGYKPDRVIVLSDMQCWDSTGYGYSLCDNWKHLQKFAPNCWLHSVHLNGYGDTPVQEGEKVNLVGSFSEKIFNTFLETEGILTKEERLVPTLEQIRRDFRL